MPRLTDQLDARLTAPVRPGRMTTDAGTLRWNADGISLDRAGLERVAAQLSRQGERPRRGLARLLGWLLPRREWLFVELRAGTHRVRLRALAAPERLEGLAELTLDGATSISLDDALALLLAVQAHDGRLIVADPAAGRLDPALAGEGGEGDEGAERASTSGARGAPWLRPALRAWPLWMAGLTMAWVMALLVDDLPAGWRAFALLGCTIGPWLTAALLWGVFALRGRLDARRAGGALGFSCTLWALVALVGSWGHVVFGLDDAQLNASTALLYQTAHIPAVGLAVVVLVANGVVERDSLKGANGYLLVVGTVLAFLGVAMSVVLLPWGWMVGAELAAPHTVRPEEDT